MRLDTGQHMKLSQDMRISPQQIQAMKILQMALPALEEHIQEELEANIALEIEEPRGRLRREDGDQETPIDQKELVVGGGADGADDFQRLGQLESRYSEAFENEYSSTRFRAGERDAKMDAMASVADRRRSLAEELEAQWRFVETDEDVARAGLLLIQYIGPDGLLEIDLDDLLEQVRGRPGAVSDRTVLERALHVLQSQLEPPGVGARDLVECLLLQIDHHAEHDENPAHDWTTVRTLVAEHLDDLKFNRLPKISEATGLEMAEIQRARELMGKLTLAPARDLVDEEPAPIIADVIVEFEEQSGAYIARLRGDRLPSLRVQPKYEEMATDRAQDRTTREFVARHVTGARALIDAIAQRRRTLLRVVEVVIARQREFFDEGPQHLKLLTMTEVADQLGLSVGTISRAVAEKWMETPRGLMPLRKFFSGGLETDSGGSMSWEAVRATLREIVDGEDKARPLSDDALARELAQRGMKIARRTVVKYREQLGIPKAALRRAY